MAPEGYGTQFTKLGTATKMALQANSSSFFHFKMIKLDKKKQYNDPIWITFPKVNGKARIIETIMEA
jgi:hypothetical protein